MPLALVGLLWFFRHPVLMTLVLSAIVFLGFQASTDLARSECRSQLDSATVEMSVASWWPPRAQCMDMSSEGSTVVGARDVLGGLL